MSHASFGSLKLCAEFIFLCVGHGAWQGVYVLPVGTHARQDTQLNHGLQAEVVVEEPKGCQLVAEEAVAE